MKGLPDASRASAIAGAEGLYSQRLVSLRSREPGLDGKGAKSIADAFAPIGAKMRPDMSQEQAGFWASSIVLALSDLPAFVVREAMAEAVHIPFQFPTDMEAKVREIAERIFARHKRALLRLRQTMEALRRMAEGEKQLPPPPEGEPMSLDELRSTPKWLRSLGLQSGAIRAEDLAAIEAEEAEKARRKDDEGQG